MHAEKKSPKDEIAVIRGSGVYLFFMTISIYIRAVDGVANRLVTTKKVEVMPGLHKVVVEYILIGYSVTVSANADLLFNVEAGHEYEIKEKDSFLVVIDTTSGVVVTSRPLNQYTTFALCPI